MRLSPLLTLVFVAPAIGATFYVEDPSLVTPPAQVAVVAVQFEKPEITDRQGRPCRFIGKAVSLNPSGPAHDWILTTADACGWAASAAPIWVVRRTGHSYEVVLSHVTYDLTVRNATQAGLRNIMTARATAARSDAQLWKFDGEKYRLARNRAP